MGVVTSITQDDVKDMKREELEDAFLSLLDFINDFESFVADEIGQETFEDICKEWAIKQIVEELEEMGYSEDEIKKIGFMIGQRGAQA